MVAFQLASLEENLWALHERLKNNRREIDKLNKLNATIYAEIEKLQKLCKHVVQPCYGEPNCGICFKWLEDIEWDKEEYTWQPRTHS